MTCIERANSIIANTNGSEEIVRTLVDYATEKVGSFWVCDSPVRDGSNFIEYQGGDQKGDEENFSRKKGRRFLLPKHFETQDFIFEKIAISDFKKVNYTLLFVL